MKRSGTLEWHMGKLKGVKKITTISILIALSVVFSYFDSLVSMGLLAVAPGIGAIFYEFRIGFANIVILLIILNFNFSDSLLSAFLKAMIVGLFTVGSNPNKLFIGLGGTMLSFFIMEFLCFLIKRKGRGRIIFISIIGAVAHGIGQIIVVYLIMRISIYSIIYTLLPSYILTGIVSGALIGFIVFTANQYVNKSIIGVIQKKSV